MIKAKKKSQHNGHPRKEDLFLVLRHSLPRFGYITPKSSKLSDRLFILPKSPLLVRMLLYEVRVLGPLLQEHVSALETLCRASIPPEWMSDLILFSAATCSSH